MNEETRDYLNHLAGAMNYILDERDFADYDMDEDRIKIAYMAEQATFIREIYFASLILALTNDEKEKMSKDIDIEWLNLQRVDTVKLIEFTKRNKLELKEKFWDLNTEKNDYLIVTEEGIERLIQTLEFKDYLDQNLFFDYMVQPSQISDKLDKWMEYTIEGRNVMRRIYNLISKHHESMKWEEYTEYFGKVAKDLADIQNDKEIV